jgi:pyruvate dehydrogenase E1 component alpha subunit
MPGVEVDGMDVMAVRDVAQTAIARARAGEGPTLIECLTYRFRGHSLADPDELRSKEEKEAWLARDPMKRFETYLLGQNLDRKHPEGHPRSHSSQIDEALTFAEQSPEPNPDELYKYIFAEN